MNNRALILSYLDRARRALQRAARWREAGATDAYYLAMLYARRMLQCARDAMAAAPASTRRRWKHADCINTRKRYARQAKQNGIVGGIVRNGRKVYANI